MKRKFGFGACVILLGGMTVYFAFTKSPVPVVGDVNPEAPLIASGLEFSKQHRFVRIDHDTLAGLARNFETIQMELFNGEQVSLRINDRQTINANDAIAYGVVEGDAGSSVVLSLAGNDQGGKTEALAGTIDFSDGRSFKIDYHGQGVHKLVEINHDSYEEICVHPPGAAGFLIAPNGKKIRLMYQHYTMREGTTVRPNRAAVMQRIQPPNAAEQSTWELRADLRRLGIAQRFNTWSRLGGAKRSSRTSFRPMNWTTFRGRPNHIFGGATVSSGGGTGGGGTGGGGTGGGGTGGGGTGGGGTGGGGTGGGGTGGGGTGGGGTGGGGTGGGGTGGGGSGDGGSPPSQSTIDIMVVYTDGAETAKGGVSGIKSHAGLAVGNVNTAYKNSGINATAKLVATEKWAGHTSSGDLSTDIKALSSDAGVTTLRTKHKADLVAALVPGAATGTTGIGSLPSGVGGNSGACWSVTKVDAVGAPARSFAHEIGHNLGAGHAKDQGGGGGAESTAYGWRFDGTDGKPYRTLLSYGKKAGEDRIPYYSNPAKTYKGTATGTASANNVSTINKLAKKVSAYK